MKLSVIVPAYNSEKTISKCLESIINQTYNDIEIIVVNDGSTDCTKEIVEQYCKLYSNIRIINKENSGNSQARKTGVENAMGDYIGFVDSDDWIEPSMYTKMINNVNIYDSDIVCCDMSFDYINRSIINKQQIDDNVIDSDKAFELLNIRKAVFASLCNKIIRRTLFNNVNFPKYNMWGEDYAINLQLLECKCKVGLVDYIGYHYVRYKNSLVLSGYNDSVKNGFNCYRYIMKHFYNNCDMLRYILVKKYMVNEFMWIAIAMSYNNKYDKDVLKWIKNYLRKNLLGIVSDKNNTLLCKVSSIAMCLDLRIVSFSYFLYSNILYKWN